MSDLHNQSPAVLVPQCFSLSAFPRCEHTGGDFSLETRMKTCHLAGSEFLPIPIRREWQKLIAAWTLYRYCKCRPVSELREQVRQEIKVIRQLVGRVKYA